jgi:hypothetical protein
MQILQRQEWEIDRRLKALLGENVRVRVSSFLPGKATVNGSPPVDVKTLRLPDNSTVDEPLFLEGKLEDFQRRIGVVYVTLGLSTLPAGEAANGRVSFRGASAVVLQGPARVQLHPTLFVERIPSDPNVYWNHLTAPEAQLDLPMPE